MSGARPPQPINVSQRKTAKLEAAGTFEFINSICSLLDDSAVFVRFYFAGITSLRSDPGNELRRRNARSRCHLRLPSAEGDPCRESGLRRSGGESPPRWYFVLAANRSP